MGWCGVLLPTTYLLHTLPPTTYHLPPTYLLPSQTRPLETLPSPGAPLLPLCCTAQVDHFPPTPRSHGRRSAEIRGVCCGRPMTKTLPMTLTPAPLLPLCHRPPGGCSTALGCVGGVGCVGRGAVGWTWSDLDPAKDPYYYLSGRGEALPPACLGRLGVVARAAGLTWRHPKNLEKFCRFKAVKNTFLFSFDPTRRGQSDRV